MVEYFVGVVCMTLFFSIVSFCMCIHNPITQSDYFKRSKLKFLSLLIITYTIFGIAFYFNISYMHYYILEYQQLHTIFGTDMSSLIVINVVLLFIVAWMSIRFSPLLIYLKELKN